MNTPELTDDEIKKYGTEVLKDLEGHGLNKEQLERLFAATGFNHLIARKAADDPRRSR